MNIKSFKLFEKITEDSMGVDLEYGDKVIFCNRKHNNYNQTGVISYIYLNDRCQVDLDFKKESSIVDSGSLLKIEFAIEKITGEVIIIPYDNIKELLDLDYIQYIRKEKAYYFDDDYKWQIERYTY